MNSTQIRIQLFLKGIRLSDIARALDVSPQAVHRVVAYKTTSRRIMAAIAKEIERPPAEVFPWAAHIFDSNLSRPKGIPNK